MGGKLIGTIEENKNKKKKRVLLDLTHSWLLRIAFAAGGVVRVAGELERRGPLCPMRDKGDAMLSVSRAFQKACQCLLSYDTDAAGMQTLLGVVLDRDRGVCVLCGVWCCGENL